MSHSQSTAHRREFLGKASAIASLGAVGSLLASTTPVHAAGTDKVKYALIGCGGRGSGAAVDAAKADPNAELIAVADIFPDRVENLIGRSWKAICSDRR
jgi:myo-inositol 2-dehydrogenase / D-chiro-inositol 1-dehydrogenase